jgi:methionyl aminopeptidase
MSVQKSWSELQKMHEACTLVVLALDLLEEAAVPGTTTKELDLLAFEFFKKHRARPAFLGYRGYPATLCASINDEVVHGIPSEKRRIKDGDIVGFDLGCSIDGLFGDSARTVAVGKVSEKAARLMDTTKAALHSAIEVCHPGRRVGDIGQAVQTLAEGRGYSVVREFVGHGIGRSLHEDPQVPNYGPGGKGKRLVPGMALAIEPMVNAGRPEVRVLDDNWTAVTADGSLSAHFELSVAITEHGPWILSEPYPYAGEAAIA